MRSDPAAVFAPLPLPQPDAMPNNNSALRQLWLSAPPGRMSPWQQARALALREVSRLEEVEVSLEDFCTCTHSPQLVEAPLGDLHIPF